MTDTIPEWAVDRALQELGDLATYNDAADVRYWAAPPRHNRYARQVLVFARCIAQHEVEPVDPLQASVDELMLNYDGCSPRELALRALIRGMVLAKEKGS